MSTSWCDVSEECKCEHPATNVRLAVFLMSLSSTQTQASAADSGHVIREAFEKLIQHISNLRTSQLSMMQRKDSSSAAYASKTSSSNQSTTRSCQELKRNSDNSPVTPIHKKSLTSHFNFFASNRKISISSGKNVWEKAKKSNKLTPTFVDQTNDQNKCLKIKIKCLLFDRKTRNV